jgi:biopolymer transport protein ExbB/TolQ
MDFMSFLKNNFWHVAPNIGLGVIAVVIILERFQALFMKYKMPSPEALQSFMMQLQNQILRANIKDAINQCTMLENSNLAARVIKEGLTRANLPESSIQDGLSMGLNRLSMLLQARISFLSVIANVATLIGLVGTIVGLIDSFEALAFADPQQKSTLLASGISTSMNATLLGLAVAIVCLLAYSLLSHQSNKILAEIEQAAMMSLDWLRQRAYGVAGSPDEK